MTAVVRTGTEALQKVSETYPDVVVMDLQLSGLMHGLEVVERIEREHTPVPKFLFITGLSIPDAAMIKNGHCRVLRKPYFSTDVITAIGQLVHNGNGAENRPPDNRTTNQKVME